MTWKCKTGGCEYDDLPDDFPLLCVCASLTHGKITEADLDGPRELKRLRTELAEAKREIGAAAIVRSVGVLNELSPIQD